MGVDQRVLEIILRAKDETEKGLSSAQKAVSKGSLGKNLAIGGAAAIGAATAVTAALNGAADSAAAYGQQVLNVQRLTGLNAKASSDAAGLMDRYGVSGKQLGMVFKTLDTQIVTTNTHSGKTATALELMHIKTKDATGANRDSMAVLGDVAQWYSTQKDKTLAAAEAAKVLGRGYMSLLPVLANGKAGIDKVTEGLHNNGLEMSQGQIDAVKGYGAAQKDAEESWKGMVVQVGNIILPLKTKIINAIGGAFSWLNAHKADIIAFFKPFVDGAGKLSVALMGMWKDIQPALTQFWNMIGPMLSQAWGNLQHMFMAHPEVLKGLKLLFEGIAIGIGVALVAIVGIVDAFSWLMDKAAAVQQVVYTAFEAMWKTISGFVNAIAGPLQAAGNLLQNLNPLQRHSPSLVDNVLAGVHAIKGAYSGLGGMSIGAPSIGAIASPAFAYGGSGASGASPHAVNTELLGLLKDLRRDGVQSNIDGHALSRGLGRVENHTSRSGAR